jgi:hypothetical protein
MAENARASPTCNPRGYRFKPRPRQNQFNWKTTNGIPDSKKVHLSRRKKKDIWVSIKSIIIIILTVYSNDKYPKFWAIRPLVKFVTHIISEFGSFIQTKNFWLIFGKNSDRIRKFWRQWHEFVFCTNFHYFLTSKFLKIFIRDNKS